MSWQQAHRYYQALRTARADLERTEGAVVWREEYAAVFGTEQRLLLALRSYWDNTARAQVEICWDADGHPSPEALALVRAHRGLVRAVHAVGPLCVQESPDDLALVGAA
jgi:hypothetical protein